MIWWIIFGVFAVFILLLIKAEHSGRKIKLAFILIILLIIYFSVVGWFASDNVDLSSPKGVVNSFYLYFGWVGGKAVDIFQIGKSTGQAIFEVIKGDNSTSQKKISDGRK